MTPIDNLGIGNRHKRIVTIGTGECKQWILLNLY